MMMQRRMMFAGLVAALAGCGVNGSREAPKTAEEASPDIVLRPRMAEATTVSLDALRDPEVANGLTKTMLGVKAFTVDDFGSPPEGNAEAVIQGLEAAARAGSGRASYEIHLKLYQCSNLLKPSGERTPMGRDRWRECNDLSPERLMEEVDWLRLAAAQGHLGAQIRFASDAEAVLGGISGIFKEPDAVKEYKRQSMEFLEAAARRGSVDALSRIADAYLHGLKVERDPGASYAYYMAMQRATPQLSVPANMRYLEKELTAKQLESAREKSMEIYNECCSN